jgi:hypothetical protein
VSGPGPCDGITAAATLVSTLSSTNSAYGFSGDPFRPVSGRYYGYTAVAGTPSEAPSFTLGASPASRSVSRGGSTTYTIGVDRTNGFASPVSLSVSGLPNRSNASFSPNPASATDKTSTLTVSTSSKTTRGTRTLTITGTGGGRSRTVQVTLTVN